MNNITTVENPESKNDRDQTSAVALLPEHRGLIIPSGSAARLEHATRIIIVAGTANIATAAAKSPKGAAVVGLATIYNWRSLSGGVPLTALNELVNASVTFYIYAYGRTKDAEVYTEVQNLGRHLSRSGAAAVLFLDDDLAELSTMLTSEGYLDSMLADATVKLGQRPGKKQEVSRIARALAPVVDVEELSTYMVGADGSTAPLMNAAIVRDRTYRVQDDLRDLDAEDIERTHDVTVSYVFMGRRYDSPVKNVSSADLANPRKILDRVMTPGTDSVMVSGYGGAGEHIENAIRNSNPDALEIPVFRRTGWKELEGRSGFMHLGGWITSTGNEDTTRSKLSPMWQALNFQDPTGGDSEIKAASHARAMHDAVALNIWIAVMGSLFHSSGGLGVGACAAIIGTNGSGKSAAVEALTSFLSQKLSRDPMSVMDSSAAQIRRSGEGLDSLILVVDDKRDLESSKMREAADEVLEAIVRPSYSGAGAAKAVNTQTSAGKWLATAADKSDYIRVLIGEELPEGDSQNSTRERLYPVMTEFSTTFNGGLAEELRRLAASDLPQLHFSHFLRWVAGRMDKAGGRGPWVESWNEEKAALYARMAALPVARRVKEVGCVPLLGYLIWCQYLFEAEAIPLTTHAEMVEAATQAVEKNVLWHGTYNVNDSGSSTDRLLDSIRQILASGLGYIDAAFSYDSMVKGVFCPIDERTPPMGYLIHGRNGTGAYVAMVPQTLAGLLGRLAKKDISSRVLTKTLASVAITDAGSSHKRVRINGVATSAICIPIDLLLPGHLGIPTAKEQADRTSYSTGRAIGREVAA